MKLAYIDSCVWITWIEGLPAYRQIVASAMQTLAGDGWIYCVSDAVKLEVLVNPLRAEDTALIQTYRQLFEHCRSLRTQATVFRKALSIACSEKLKGMDAAHVAIAERHHCQRFVSTDPHFANLQLITPFWISLDST